MNSEQLKIKKNKLEALLGQFESLYIAFSGGVDSTFLLAVACDVLKHKVTAVSALSPLQPDDENLAGKIARELGARHITFHSHELSIDEFCINSKDRCYVCKKNLFQEIGKIVRDSGGGSMAHGANMDDLDDYRPGFRAAKEMNVAAPLIDAGLTKADIRQLSRQMGLVTWNMPSAPCLATRIPYGTIINKNLLDTVESAETILKKLGLADCRVRYHGTIARIEVAEDAFPLIINDAVRQAMVEKFRSLGFSHVALDLEGYTRGGMNRDLNLLE